MASKPPTPPTEETGAPLPGGGRTDETPQVLFILGKGRSGSTLLDVTLGATEGFFSLGEVWWAWGDQNQLDQKTCGCGRRVGDCPVWGEALARTREGWGNEDGGPPSLSRVAEWQNRVARWSRLPKALRMSPETIQRWPEMAGWARFCGLLYRSLAQVTGARVLVDSSKWMGNPGPLGLVPGIRSQILHLVRDPRAVAFSWRRRKDWLPGETVMPRFGAIHSAVSWNARNLLAGQVAARAGRRGLRIRYEDFTANPKKTLEEIFDLLGVPRSEVPLLGENTVVLPENHTAMGNSSRFRTGRIELRYDTEWKGNQRALTGGFIAGMTLPLLLRYGYPLSPGSAGRLPPDPGEGSFRT